MSWSRWLLLGALIFGFALVLLLGPDDQTVIRESAAWRSAARHSLLTAIACFFVAEVVLVALSAPVGIWMSALGGFLFGFWIGTAVVSVAAMLGALLAFLAARHVFFDAIHRLARSRPRFQRWLVAIDRGFHDHGAYYVLLLRLTPVIPFWALNLGLGLTRLRLRDYWWATQLGMLPATLVVVNAGASLAELTSLADLISWRVIGALALLPVVPFVLHHTAGRWLASRENQRARSIPGDGGQAKRSPVAGP
jgi:uncharacterized membrane protein YdjX (TVP38/TMEM64 family)